MNLETFEAEAQAESAHWWFVGRRTLFAREITRLGIPPHSCILDIGTSTGTNLRMLRDEGYHNVTGLDSSEVAIHWCAAKGLGRVLRGDITSLPFPGNHADLVLATDVIEHVDDHETAVAEVVRVLKPGAAALFTVPAFSILWGLQDEVAHHKRRYLKPELETLLTEAGLVIERSYYFNYLLFLPILAARQLMRVRRPDVRSENEINSPLINRLLQGVFLFDVGTAPRLHPPFGVSVLVIARKPVGMTA